jgi:hypothetical protein
LWVVGGWAIVYTRGFFFQVTVRIFGWLLNPQIHVPTFAGELANIPSKIKLSGAPLTFKTDGIGRPSDVTLIPYYRMAHQHYNMYWKIL